MSQMYNALNEQYMFQAQHDRVAGMHAVHAAREAHHGNRRWWRRGARRAR
jgi:hypothetical protein